MRYVDRSPEPEPAALSSDATKREIADASNYFTPFVAASKDHPPKPVRKGRGRKKNSFKFKAYSDASVRRALNNLFNGKCAYCESRYASVHPMEVEHWRPKGAVFEDDNGKKLRSFGYYWLAATWTNLLPSCIDCNRIRSHVIGTDGSSEMLGKGNWFPLAKGSKRATLAGEESSEQPLLLDPCSDEPSEHLRFLDNGFVISRRNVDGSARERGEASIRFYGLNRPELVLDRLERARMIEQKFSLIGSLAGCLAELSRAKAQMAELIADILANELTLLQQFRDPKQPFSQMARDMIDPFIESYRPPD